MPLLALVGQFDAPQMQFEVLEFAIRGDIRAGGFVHQAAGFHDPTRGLAGLSKVHPLKSRPLKQRDRLAPLEIGPGLGEPEHAGPSRPGRTVRAFRRA